MAPAIMNPQTNCAEPTSIGALVPRWIGSSHEASTAAKSEDSKTVWIVKKTSVADYIAHLAAELRSYRKAGYVVLLWNARAALVPVLEKRFRAVVCAPSALPKDELNDVLKAADRKERFIGGIIDHDSKSLTLWRGNLVPVVVPFGAFPPTSNGIRPEFDKFSVTDYGKTLKFGEYESDADAVLYEFAPDFRKHIKKTRFAQEQSLGASIRRLRKQRRLTLNDFGTVGPKTLARIERGLVRRPHPSTVRLIAKKLGVPEDELGSY